MCIMDSPACLYLDTQQWNYLVEHEGSQPRLLRDARRCLRDAVTSGRVEIVGSLPLAQEISRTRHGNPAKFRAMRNLVLATVGHRWLRPLNERAVAESWSGPLPERSRYLLPTDATQMHRVLNDPREVEIIARATRAEVDEFVRTSREIRGRVEAILLAAGSEDLPSEVSRWWESGRVDEWVADILVGGVGQGGATSPRFDGPMRKAVPSVWSFIAFKMARIKLNLGDARRIEAGDYFDAEHYGASPYFEVLVTDDRRFAETVAMIPQPVDVRDFDWLLTELGV
jgi:hypothetical protein